MSRSRTRRASVCDRQPSAWAITRTPRRASWRAAGATSSHWSCARRRAGRRRRDPGRDPARACRGGSRRVASRVMVEPLAPDGPQGTYGALLRAQHADGLIISGPRTDDPALLDLRREGVPGRAPGPPARRRRRQRRRRQRGGRARRCGASAVARPPTDRLHHECPARLYRRRGTPSTVTAQALDAAGLAIRRRAHRSTAPSMPPAAMQRWRPCWRGTSLRRRVRGQRCRRARRHRRAARSRPTRAR